MFTRRISLPEGACAWFMADLHLWDERPSTLLRFQGTLSDAVRDADALFILGDLFEYWAGDDDFETSPVVSALNSMTEATQRGLAIYFMHGNRDFLFGAKAAEQTGVQLLEDECCITIGTRRLLAMHGDSLCTDDHEYQVFRRQVRDPSWQANFLSRPLAQRHALIADIRTRSEERKSRLAETIMDVNAEAVAQVMAKHGVRTLVHGHTHRPARHDLPDGGVRFVLSDWEYDASPHRGEAFVISHNAIV